MICGGESKFSPSAVFVCIAASIGRGFFVWRKERGSVPRKIPAREGRFRLSAPRRIFRHRMQQTRNASIPGRSSTPKGAIITMSCSHNRSSCGCNGRESRNLLRSCGCSGSQRAYAGCGGSARSNACGYAVGGSSCPACCNGCCKRYPFYTGPCPSACETNVCCACPCCGCNNCCNNGSNGCRHAQVTMPWNDECGCNSCRSGRESCSRNDSNCSCTNDCSTGCNTDCGSDCNTDCGCND